jgi:hypothetical protein
VCATYCTVQDELAGLAGWTRQDTTGQPARRKGSWVGRLAGWLALPNERVTAA